jgi:hypothetical protein
LGHVVELASDLVLKTEAEFRFQNVLLGHVVELASDLVLKTEAEFRFQNVVVFIIL